MLDLKYLRQNLTQVTQKLATRGYIFDLETFSQLEKNYKRLQERLNTLQHQSNLLAKKHNPHQTIQTTQASTFQKETQPFTQQLKQELRETKTAFQSAQEKFECFLMTIPNVPETSVPIGHSAADNQTIRMGKEVERFDFTPKDHVTLCSGFDKMMDFEVASQMTGSRFVVLRAALAKLHRALVYWMLEVHVNEHHYEEVDLPYLVNAQSLQATGQLPLFGEDLFALSHNNFYLIPTGEVPLTNLARNQLFEGKVLPKKYVTYTQCFRREAGSYGKDVKGMIRQHQFGKVELVQFVTPKESLEALEALTKHAEAILQKLELPYRVVSLCTQDLGFHASKTYDLEVWLPGQSQFREISSCSYIGDFQARRLKARWRENMSQKPTWIHTLNGSGLAVGRTLVAILENYQQKDGSIRIPTVLQPYMGGLTLIQPE